MSTPTRIGRYQIIREIGRGAMGLVYLAHDPRIDRRVAIKTIHAIDMLPSGEAEAVRLRFTREAQAAGRLQHPGIVTIFDVAEHDGTSFIAMEYIEGDTLEPHTRKRNLLPPDRTLDIILQACDALEYAHQAGIVHRDIKPANVMLLRSGKVKLTDFGLAKNPTTNLTQEGILIGTPNYMSPEQVMGKPLDGRSDLFSLAAVMYEMLTGERPFAGESVATIVYKILHEQPADPPTLNQQVPLVIGRAVMKALDKDPARRFQTCAEFAAGLQEEAVAMAAAGIGGGARVIVPARESLSRAPVTIPVPRPARPEPAEPLAAERSGRAERPGRAPEGAEIVPATARLGWYGLASTAFIPMGALAIVLLTPAAGTIDDRWGRAGATGEKPFYQTAGLVTPGSPPAAAGPAGAGATAQATAATPAAIPQVALPGSEGSVWVTFKTSPPGGRIYANDAELAGGFLRVSLGDKKTYAVVAENDCFIEKIDYRLEGEGSSQTRTIEMKTPKVVAVPVESSPAGARIVLDGRDTGLVTPADLALSVCDPHTVALRKEGYKDVEQSVEKAPASLSLALSRIPKGSVLIETVYKVEVFEAGARVGSSGTPFNLTEGQHTLTLKNADLFVEKQVTVTVEADKTIRPAPGLPAVGSLTVLASPSNCSIFINGREVGAPPINDHPLAAGTYKIRAVYLPTGEVKETTVTIAGGGGSRVPFKFRP